MSHSIKIERFDATMLIRLNKPELRNAFDLEMRAELAEANQAMKATDAKPGTAPRWQVRVMNDDGLVLHDGPVSTTGGGK